MHFKGRQHNLEPLQLINHSVQYKHGKDLEMLGIREMLVKRSHESAYTNTKTTQILDSAGKDFIITIINMLKDLNERINTRRKL